MKRKQTGDEFLLGERHPVTRADEPEFGAGQSGTVAIKLARDGAR